jgi:cytochrome c
MKRIFAAFCALALLQLALPARAAGDAGRGAQVFRHCMACHSTGPGEHMTGPSLAHAWGARAATAEGFQRYSEALERSNLTWNDATLDKWLANPAALVPGTSMTFPGIKNAQARQDVIAYLKAIAQNKAPGAAKGGGGMMMGMAPHRTDLKAAPPEGQVRSLTHCGDTYTVTTADGKTEKVWEFNLRLKTDTSKYGPAPGKPVIVGAGMQGDRASVVFSSPKEIGETIKESCPKQ